MTKRKLAETDVKVYSNCRNVTLYVNGKRYSTAQPDEINRCVFSGITLKQGENTITVVAKTGNNKTLKDSCIWIFEQ